MRTIVYTVLGLAMLCGGGFAQAKKAAAAGSDEAALLALEAKWDAANLKGDAAGLEAIYADTFVSTNSEGKLRTRAEVLTEVKSGAVKYLEAKASGFKVALYGDAAVVTGQWKGKFVEKGKTVETVERFTDTWIRQNGQWRCVASHGSAIK
jgi:hypothetical protein